MQTTIVSILVRRSPNTDMTRHTRSGQTKTMEQLIFQHILSEPKICWSCFLWGCHRCFVYIHCFCMDFLCFCCCVCVFSYIRWSCFYTFSRVLFWIPSFLTELFKNAPTSSKKERKTDRQTERKKEKTKELLTGEKYTKSYFSPNPIRSEVLERKS